MPLLSVSYANFRNIKDDMLHLNAKEIFFVGENGQGKSNLLESIYILAYGSSFRTRSDAELVKNGADAFGLKTLFSRNGDSADSVFVSYEKGGGGKKKIVKNGKTLRDRRDLITTMPCVLFCHDDLSFAVGEPERRRFFVDQCLAMYDLMYLDVVRNYAKVLKSRNQVLKESRADMLDVLDQQLSEFGVQIQKMRGDAIFKFNQIFGGLYERITGISGVSIKYSPSWKTGSGAPPLASDDGRTSLQSELVGSIFLDQRGKFVGRDERLHSVTPPLQPAISSFILNFSHKSLLIAQKLLI